MFIFACNVPGSKRKWYMSTLTRRCRIEFVLTAGKHEVSKSTGAAAAVVFGGKDLRACAPLTTQLSQRCAVCLSENSVRTTDNLEHEICPSWTRKDTRRERENDGQTS